MEFIICFFIGAMFVGACKKQPAGKTLKEALVGFVFLIIIISIIIGGSFAALLNF